MGLLRSTIVDMSGSPTIPRQSPASPSPEVDAYFDACPESSRARLIMLREVIREEAPHATERIAYGTATWHDGENIIHIGGYARHVGVYPGAAAMIATTQRVAKAVKKSLNAPGIMLAQLNGAPAGQSVFHVHFHIIPRSAGVDMGLHSRGMVDAKILEPIAAKIRSEL